MSMEPTIFNRKCMSLKNVEGLKFLWLQWFGFTSALDFMLWVNVFKKIQISFFILLLRVCDQKHFRQQLSFFCFTCPFILSAFLVKDSLKKNFKMNRLVLVIIFYILSEISHAQKCRVICTQIAISRNLPYEEALQLG